MPALSQNSSSSGLAGSRPSSASSPGTNVDQLATATRSLSVSFNGDSFFYQTGKHKPATHKTAAEQRSKNSSSTPARSGESESQTPEAATLRGDLLMRSLNCSAGKKDPILAALRLLLLERRSDSAAAAPGAEGTSSKFNSKEEGSKLSPMSPSRTKAIPRGINVPARFWQGTKTTPKKPPFNGPGKPPPQSSAENHSGQVNGGAPSLISFAAEVRRSSRGEERIDEAHLLRLLHNRHLQWAFVNARAHNILAMQELAVQKWLYSAWKAQREIRYAVASKKMKLQQLGQRLKLTSIIENQMACLEEWSLVDEEHTSSLLSSSGALRASTLRLPIMGGAKADIKEVRDAIESASAAIQAARSSVYSMFFRVGGAASLVSELAQLAVEEKALLVECRELFSVVQALHAIQCSLRGQVMQLSCNARRC